MAGRVLLSIFACGLALASVSCEKVQPKFDESALTYLDAIPADVGTLIGVTATVPEWADLWYQKPDKSIVVVTVNARKGLVYGETVTIPRK